MDLIGDRTLRDLIEEKADSCPDRPFLIFEDREGVIQTYTYREFDTSVNQVANGFLKNGVQQGDNVVVHLANGPAALVSWFALAKIGAVMIPTNTASTAAEMEYILAFSEANTLVADAQFMAMVSGVLPGTPSVRRVFVTGAVRPLCGAPWTDLSQGQPESLAPARIRGETLAEIIFTSGTTSRPKGVMITHANCLWAGERASKQIRLAPDERNLTALPWFHANAQVNCILPALTVGGTVVLLETYSASRFWEQVRRHRANVLSLLATMLRTISAQPPRPSDADHAVRVAMYSINCTAAEKREFEERFAVELLNGYGLTETVGNAIRAPVDGKRRWPSIGLPTLEREVRIVDEQGQDVKRGEVGELIIRGVPGRTMMLGYYNAPAVTAEAIREGWLFTGDNAWMDELGYVYFFDRKKDVIKRGGENVSASEVERVLMEHPAVLECAVLGVPDPIRDEAVKAVIVPRPGSQPSREEIETHCAGRLAKFKCPQLVEFVSGPLPRTSIGKVDKKALRGG